MNPLSTDLAKGLPPSGAPGDFLGRDGAGNLFLLRWSAGGWVALGYEGAGAATRPTCRALTGVDQGLITAHRALGKAICRADLDAAVLAVLAQRDVAITAVIRGIVATRPGWRDLTTRRILTACRRLERARLIEQAQTSYAVTLSWRITQGSREQHHRKGVH